MRKRIPDRWLNYTPIGKQIKGTRFVAFKVPLSADINKSVENINTRFEIEQLLKQVPNLGMIIDLTNTDKYYNSKVFDTTGIKYVKLMVPGHNIPETKYTEKFAGCVNEFIEDQNNNEKLIGVHCTHGVNRTGYLICHHMITSLKCPPEQAMKVFEEARGHPIERQNYRDKLASLAKEIHQSKPSRSPGQYATLPQHRSPNYKYYSTTTPSLKRSHDSGFCDNQEGPRVTQVQNTVPDNWSESHYKSTHSNRLFSDKERAPGRKMWPRGRYNRAESTRDSFRQKSPDRGLLSHQETSQVKSWRRVTDHQAESIPETPYRRLISKQTANDRNPKNPTVRRYNQRRPFKRRQEPGRPQEWSLLASSSSRRDPLPSNDLSSRYSVMADMYANADNTGRNRYNFKRF